MILDVALLKTQHYKVRIKGKVEQSSERSRTFPLHLGVEAIKKGAFGSLSTKGRQLYFLNGFKNQYILQIIQFNANHFFERS